MLVSQTNEHPSVFNALDDDNFQGKVFRIEPVRGDRKMRVPKRALESVVYIGALLQDDPTPENFCTVGTGFFTACTIKGGETDPLTFFQLVTAKHVIRDLQGFPPAIRINAHDDHAAIVPVPKEAGIFCHTDQSIDAAVIRWYPDHTKYRWRATEEKHFVNEQTLEKGLIGIGDEVFTIGLFSPV